jgi:hypothetical protein
MIDITPNATLSVVEAVKCTSRDHFNRFFNSITKEREGEGVILRDPKAWYYQKNSFYHKQVRYLKKLS